MLSVPGDFEAVSKPITFDFAETDMQLSRAKEAKIAAVLSARVAAGALAEFSARLWPGTDHGFAARGDPAVAADRAGMDGAFRGTADFFNKHLALPVGTTAVAAPVPAAEPVVVTSAAAPAVATASSTAPA